MRTIEQSKQFKKDLKREHKGRHASYLADILQATLTLFVNDEPLPVAQRDHALTGKWQILSQRVAFRTMNSCSVD